MSRPIQVIPQGLLGFLQLKNLGQNPVEFPEVLQPVMELRDWYTEGDVRLASGATANIGTGAEGTVLTATLTVPSEEQWILKNLLATIQLGAADAVSGYVGFQPPSFFATGTMRVMGPKNADVAVGAARRWSASWNTNGDFIVAPPGSRFAVYLERALMAAPTPATLYIAYVPVPI